MADTPQIIVGGGLGGIFSAKILQEQGYTNITIIEKSDRLGGLLQSLEVKNPLGNGASFYFDNGTHFILAPKDSQIDRIILEDIDLEDFMVFSGSLQEGHVLNGTLNTNSGCADIGAFPADIRLTIMKELGELHAQSVEGELGEITEPLSLLHAFQLRYGETATKHIYGPAYEKFTGCSVTSLDTTVGQLFAPSRLIVADRQASSDLKKHTDWDWRVAFADCNDGSSEVVKYYPKNGGIEAWLNLIIEKLVASGVNIVTNTMIEHLDIVEDKIRHVRCSNNQNFECSRLIWTVPPIMLANLSGLSVPSARPIIRKTLIAHFITDNAPITRPHWVTIYDDNFLSYRVTLYDNYGDAKPDHYRISVEVLHDGDLCLDNIEGKIFNELKVAGIIPENSICLWSKHFAKAEGFPLFSSEILKAYGEQFHILDNAFSNVNIVSGRPEGGAGQINVMTQILKHLS